jgi:hypothetical protein
MASPTKQTWKIREHKFEVRKKKHARKSRKKVSQINAQAASLGLR